MSNGRVLLLVGVSVLSSACALDVVAGSGKVVTEPRTVSGFSRVSLSGFGHVVIERAGSESLTITTDDNLLPYIRTEVTGHTLELGFNDVMTNVRPTQGIVFRLNVKSLEELEVSGSGKIDVKGLDEDHLRVGISGSGELSAEGVANDLDVDISGSGRYRGEALESRRATVDISGSGGAIVAASDRLAADVSGSGSIEYVGDPQIRKHISGSGSVRQR